ncbi:PQQ-binding-like beta-propeller repeat protein [uncultured Cellulomonas sp.]|uniref:outer membrane protein assembly factor BamB family protein n=1 Tax=uncultured Cellulomonas sp. TaxID=189682 RepID=UPI0028E95617|nr:PQQ-binding-like beta-propeller repeat protein [uncultured Cellulomonas sp.]
MGRPGDLLEVELEDPSDPDRPTPRQHRRRWWLVVGVTAVASALVVTQWVVDARENAAVARLAQVPGVLAPVDDVLEVVGTLTPQDTATLTGEAYGVLLRGEDGAQSYRWYEPADEGPGWTAPLVGDPARAVDPVDPLAGTRCVPDALRGKPRRVVCLVRDGGWTGSDELRTITTEVVVLDTADGSVLARWPLERGTELTTLPGDVAVVGLAVRFTSLVVTAYDALTGHELWTYEEPWADGIGDLDLFRAGDLVGMAGPTGELTLLSPDGVVVRDGISGWGWESDPRDGALILRGQPPESTWRTTLVARDGDPDADVTFDGDLLRPVVDDGSAPGLLLTGDVAVHAWDAGTGAARWTTDVWSTTTALVLRGRVFVTTARELVALDGRSGRVLWRSAGAPGLTPSTLLTDGEHVLVALERTNADAVPAVVAYDPASGTEVLRAPYPDGVIEVGALGRTLIGRDAASGEQVELG